MRMIIQNDLAFSLVESMEFKAVINLLRPDAHLLTGRTMHNSIIKTFELERGVLKEKLQVILSLLIIYQRFENDFNNNILYLGFAGEDFIYCRCVDFAEFPSLFRCNSPLD